MGSKVEYVESSHIYATDYVRNSKAIGVLWAVFTICYGIIVTVAFLSPEWIGDTAGAEYPGRFGLWSACSYTGSSEQCLSSIGVRFTYSALAAGLAAFSILLAAATILAIPLFLFCPSTALFKTSGWLQTISGAGDEGFDNRIGNNVFLRTDRRSIHASRFRKSGFHHQGRMAQRPYSVILNYVDRKKIGLSLVGSVGVYPLSWDSEAVRRTCGQAADRFILGDCSIRWAYILAGIACLDAFILASLAFILASRHIKLQPEPIYTANGSLYKGEVNGGFMGDGQSIAGSRKSLNLHPVLLMPQPGDMDRYSEFSNRTGRSKSSAFRPDYSSSIHNFQL